MALKPTTSNSRRVVPRSPGSSGAAASERPQRASPRPTSSSDFPTGVGVIPGARELAGVEMSLVGELGRERFLHDALEPILDSYDQVVIDTPPNLGLLTVNALVCAERVIAPVSAEDEGAVHGIVELKGTIAKPERLAVSSPALLSVR